MKKLYKEEKIKKEIIYAVFKEPELHYRACYEDISGRPIPLECCCPIKEYLKQIISAPEK